MKVGIVGLPNVGKSTIFNALTASDIPANNYPFCTIDPNMGIVKVPDERLYTINDFIETEKIINTIIEFVDIAGLVRGASSGEGLGNQFLSHIRNVDAIVHVVRLFENSDITHVEGDLNPLRDIEIIETELIIKDIESVEKRLAKMKKTAKSGDKQAIIESELLEKTLEHLNSNKWLYNLDFTSKEKEIIDSWFLLTNKPMIYLCNVDEESIQNISSNSNYISISNHAKANNFICLKLCGHLEMEISKIDDKNEKHEFLEMYNLEEVGLDTLVSTVYNLLGLITFFTAGPKEIRAWTIRKDSFAPQAAGVIHTDFERGFIKAEIYTISDLVQHKTEVALKEKGLIRLEGKNYVMNDGDVVVFKFNV